jgi:1,4-dihydroxy-2-naphthoate octaprenyltransferase
MFRNILRLSRPLHLLLAALTYVLGASIPGYLGRPFQLTSFWMGLLAVLLLQLSMSLLNEVFRPSNEPILENETIIERLKLRNNALYISIAALTVFTVIGFVLYLNAGLSIPSRLFLILSLILAVLYAIPPFRLLNRGFGEVILAAQIAYAIPSIGFLLRSEESHRLLIFIIAPLTALALAYFLILNFVTFASDQKYQRGTLLRRLTWERAVPLHHGLILFAYAFFAVAPLFGFAFDLIWPAFLALPFALFQIVQLRAVALGNPPNWTLLTSTALSVLGLTAYFLTLTFWLR